MTEKESQFNNYELNSDLTEQELMKMYMEADISPDGGLDLHKWFLSAGFDIDVRLSDPNHLDISERLQSIRKLVDLIKKAGPKKLIGSEITVYPGRTEVGYVTHAAGPRYGKVLIIGLDAPEEEIIEGILKYCKPKEEDSDN